MEPGRTTWLIGADEAGYGPNLGPLVVAATAWRFDDPSLDPREVDLDGSLASAVSKEPTPGRIAVADSKRLYKPGGGLKALELAALSLQEQPPPTWSALVTSLRADPGGRLSQVPWHEGFDPRLPLEAGDEALAERSGTLHAACRTAGCHPTARARLVFPEEFNALVDHYGTKGAALSHVTLELVRQLIPPTFLPTARGPLPAFCICDKHGGRNRYGALLQHFWPDTWVETLVESRAESRYRLGGAEFAFCSKGEAFLPVAWASMTAKYLRELSMKAFNGFWARQVPGLRPTAGYPVDAKRFRQEIAAAKEKLGVDDRVLWRNR